MHTAPGDRLSQVKKLLTRRGLSHVLISDPVDVEYLCGFNSSNVNLLVSARRCLLATDFRYRTEAGEFCRRHPPWRFVEIKENSPAFLTPRLARGDRVGFQSNALTVDRFHAIRACCPGVLFVKLSETLTDLSIPKLPAEIAAMGTAAAIADAALAQLVKRLPIGVTEQEAADLLERACKDLGSQRPSFETIVLFGARTALPHGRPSRARLRRGAWVLIDFGCTVAGLCSDMTRTFVAGPASARQRHLYEVVSKAQVLARAGVRAGERADRIDALARDAIRQAGYGDYFGHATGHGVGRRIHERPSLRADDPFVLPPSAVVTVEPGIYIPGFGGVRIEDMVVVTATGGRLLTHSPRQLMEIALW